MADELQRAYDTLLARFAEVLAERDALRKRLKAVERAAEPVQGPFTADDLPYGGAADTEEG